MRETEEEQHTPSEEELDRPSFTGNLHTFCHFTDASVGSERTHIYNRIFLSGFTVTCLNGVFGKRKIANKNCGIVQFGESPVNRRCHSHYRIEARRAEAFENGNSERNRPPQW